MIFNHDGHFPVHNAIELYCTMHRLNHYAWMTLYALQRIADYNCGLAFTSAAGIAEMTRATTPRDIRGIQRAQARLKDLGAIYYGDHTNGNQVYFVALKILIGGRNGYRVTNLWPHAVKVADAKKVLPKKCEDKAGQLFQILVSPDAGPAWPAVSKLREVFSKTIETPRLTAAQLLAPPPAKKSKPEPKAAKDDKPGPERDYGTDAQYAGGRAFFEAMGEKLFAGGNENVTSH